MKTTIPHHFRAHGRRRVDLVARLRALPAASSPGAVRVRVRDLGLGGAGFDLDADPAVSPLEPGASVSLELVAPSLWDPLLLRGRVVWLRSRPEGGLRAGLRFEHHDAAALYALYELLGAGT